MKNKILNIKERILQIPEKEGITKQSFFEKISMTYGNFTGKSKNTPINSNAIEDILLKFPHINPDWLLLGDGEMYRTKRSAPENTLHQAEIERLIEVLPMEIDHVRPKITEGIGVPYFDVDFVGGFDVVINDQTINPIFHINYPPFNDCTCWVNLIGDSMKGDSDKSIIPNSIIALKYENDWQGFTLLNENYAIVTDEFRTVKMLGEGKDERHFNMIPHNKYYSEQQIPKEMIRHLFRVKGAMKKFF